jgi:hypothetical protein
MQGICPAMVKPFKKPKGTPKCKNYTLPTSHGITHVKAYPVKVELTCCLRKFTKHYLQGRREDEKIYVLFPQKKEAC